MVLFCFVFPLFWDRNGSCLYSDIKLSKFCSLLTTCKHSSMCLDRNTSSVTLILGHLCWATVKHTQEYKGARVKVRLSFVRELAREAQRKKPICSLLWLREEHDHKSRPKPCDSPSSETSTASQNRRSSGLGYAKLGVSQQEEERLFCLLRICSPIHCSVGITFKNVRFREFNLPWAQ